MDSAERVNSEMGAMAAEFLDQLPVPDTESEGHLLAAWTAKECSVSPLNHRLPFSLGQQELPAH